MIFCVLLLVGCARIHVLGMPPPDGNSATYEKTDPPALESCGQTVEKLPILPGEPEETELFVIHSGQPGPCIFVVGGIHGDETAGWISMICFDHAKNILPQTFPSPCDCLTLGAAYAI